jgi:hypothetical protein
VLPAWATVVLAISGTLIGAAAGVLGSYFGFAGTKLSLQSQEAEAWRKTLIETATACMDRWVELGLLLAEAVAGRAPVTPPDLKTVSSLNVQIGQGLTRVSLLFGEDSPAGKAADAFQKTVGRVAGTAIKKARPWEAETLTQLKELLSEADKAMDAFVTEAHLAVRPRSNKSGG